MCVGKDVDERRCKDGEWLTGSGIQSLQVCTGAVALICAGLHWPFDMLQLLSFRTWKHIGSVLLDVLFILRGYCHMWFVYTQLLRQFSSYHSMESGGTEKYYLALARGEAGSVWVSLTANVFFQDPRWLRWQKAANRPVGKSTDKEARKVTSDLAKAESDKCAAAEHGT